MPSPPTITTPTATSSSSSAATAQQESLPFLQSPATFRPRGRTLRTTSDVKKHAPTKLYTPAGNVYMGSQESWLTHPQQASGRHDADESDSLQNSVVIISAPSDHELSIIWRFKLLFLLFLLLCFGLQVAGFVMDPDMRSSMLGRQVIFFALTLTAVITGVYALFRASWRSYTFCAIASMSTAILLLLTNPFWTQLLGCFAHVGAYALANYLRSTLRQVLQVTTTDEDTPVAPTFF